MVARTPMGFEQDFRFLARTEEDGRRLLEACGVGPRQRSFSFRAAPPVASLVWPFVIASVMLCATAVSTAAGVWTAAPVIPVLVVLAIIAVLTVGLQYARTHVEIGVHGVKLSGDVDECYRAATCGVGAGKPRSSKAPRHPMCASIATSSSGRSSTSRMSSAPCD
jgi:hypothetical protein